MRALTVKQPWASLIAYAGKDVENRTWKGPKIGERIAIHAGLGVDREALREVEREAPGMTDLVMEDAGRIVCTAVVVAYLDGESGMAWHQKGRIGWVLGDVRIATSEPIRGRLGLWEVPTGSIEELPEDGSVVVSDVDGKPEAA